MTNEQFFDFLHRIGNYYKEFPDDMIKHIYGYIDQFHRYNELNVNRNKNFIDEYLNTSNLVLDEFLGLISVDDEILDKLSGLVGYITYIDSLHFSQKDKLPLWQSWSLRGKSKGLIGKLQVLHCSYCRKEGYEEKFCTLRNRGFD